jgi:hypothetical protein
LVNVHANALGLEAQATELAQAMTSNAVLASIAHAANVPVTQLTAEGPYSGSAEILDVPTPSETRGAQIVALKPAYHLAFVAQTNVPIITATVTGPTPQAAGNMADSILRGTDTWLDTIATDAKLVANNRVVLRQLGAANAGLVNAKASLVLAVIGEIATFVLGLLAVVLIDRQLTRRRRPKRTESEPVITPANGSALARRGLPIRSDAAGRYDDDWAALLYEEDAALTPGAAGAGRPQLGSSPTDDPSSR